MKAVIQRVSQAVVREKSTHEVLGEIGPGLFILLGVEDSDTFDTVDKFVKKVSNIRVFSDKHDKMNLSLTDVAFSVLLVSQFTLLADTEKGNKPSFTKAANPAFAKEIYLKCIDEFKNQGVKIESGEFGAYMEIETLCDGPVTIALNF